MNATDEDEQKKPDSTDFTLYDSIYMRFKNSQNESMNTNWKRHKESLLGSRKRSTSWAESRLRKRYQLTELYIKIFTLSCTVTADRQNLDRRKNLAGIIGICHLFILVFFCISESLTKATYIVRKKLSLLSAFHVAAPFVFNGSSASVDFL